MANTAGKVIKCRAAIAWEVNKPLSIEEIEVDPPRDREVRIRMSATGVCHSDASLLNGVLRVSNRFPTIPGHEGAGIVESVGGKVTRFKPGDHVIPLYAGQCLQCRFCKSPKTNQCEVCLKLQGMCTMLDGTSRIRCKGQTIYQFMALGTFSEVTVVEEVSLVKINDKAPLDKVCLIGCGISTGYGAALNTAKVEPGSICGVWGLGGIGLAAVMGCRKAGAAKIYGIDINPAKFELAKKFGCTDFFNPNDYPGQNIAEVLMELTNGGFDHTFECIGLISTMRTAIDSSNRVWGQTTIIGIASMEKELGIMPFDLVVGRRIVGTYFGGFQAVDEVPKLVDEYMKKELMVDEFITHTMKLDDINDAFKLMNDGKSIRSVVIF